MRSLPKTALGLDTVDLGVAAVIVDSASRERDNLRLTAIAERLRAAGLQLAPPETRNEETRP